MEDADRPPVSALAGQAQLTATGQNGTALALTVQEAEGDTVRGLVPRLSLVGVETVSVRFVEAGEAWVARFDLESAEFHTDAEALVVLRLLEMEHAGSGHVAPRVPVHAAGMLKAVQCKNALRGNDYTVRVDDVSESGLQFTTELDLVADDSFMLTFEVGGRRLHLLAEAVAVRPGPYGRHVVGARITEWGPGDRKTIAELGRQA
jgi:hypothetical protein